MKNALRGIVASAVMLMAAMAPAAAYDPPASLPHYVPVGSREGVTVNYAYAQNTIALQAGGVASGQNVLPEASIYVSNAYPGDTISGCAGIPAGTTVLSTVANTSITMSNVTTAACTGTLTYTHNYVISRYCHVNNTGQTIVDPIFRYLNTTGQSVETPPNAINIQMALEYPPQTGALLVPLATFGAAGTTLTLQPNGSAWTDPIMAEIPNGAQFCERTVVTAPNPGTGQLIPLNRVALLRLGEIASYGSNNPPSITASMSAIVSNNQSAFNAAEVKGKVIGNVTSVLMTSDSKNGVYGGGSFYTYSTSAAAASGSAVVPLSNTHGLYAGQMIEKVGGTQQTPSNPTVIPWSASVLSVQPNVSVTLTTSLTGALASGTSILFGAYSYDLGGSVGYLEAGLSPTTSIVSLARSGDSYTQWNLPLPYGGRIGRGQVFGDGFQYMLSAMGGNDVAGNTLSTLKTLYTNMWTVFSERGMRVIQETVTPRANSSFGEDLNDPVAITAGGSGYTANFTATVAGGTLSTSLPNFTATPTTLNCTASGGAVTACTVATIGYYSTAPAIANNAITGGAGSGATVTLQAYQGYLDANSQYAQNASYQPMQTPTLTGGSAITSTTVPVSSVAGVVAGMYAHGTNIPPLTTITVSGSNIILSNAPTGTGIPAGATVTLQGLCAEFNDWIRTKPAPLWTYIDSSDALSTGRNTDIFCPKCAEASGDHAGNSGFILMQNYISGLVAGGLFSPF